MSIFFFVIFYLSAPFVATGFPEVFSMRRSAPIHVIVHKPTSLDGKIELARRVADVHAQSVHRRIKELNCPTSQKLELLDAVIATVKKRSREQTL